MIKKKMVLFLNKFAFLLIVLIVKIFHIVICDKLGNPNGITNWAVRFIDGVGNFL